MADQSVELATSKLRAKPAGAFRALHTADWHLGKMLGEHSRAEEHERFLTFLLGCIRELEVDALVVAGDIFDSANPPQSAAAQYYDFLSALFHQGGCSVVAVAGNHDSPAHLEAPRQVLRALRAHVVGKLPDSCADLLVPLPADSPRVVVAGVPFLRDRDLRTGQPGQGFQEIREELARGIVRRYQEVAEAARTWTSQGLPMLVTGHLAVLGSALSESEREIHVGGLGVVGADCFPESFAYVALGHLHRPQAAGGCETVRYAGSPIPLSFSEAGDRKEVRLLEFADGRLVCQAALEVPLVRPLAQLCLRREALEQELRAFQPPAGELPTWVEVVVEDAKPGENLYDLVQDLVKGREFEVIRVTGRRTAPVAGLAGAEAAPEDIEQLLGDPVKTFAHRLEEEPSLNEEDKAALRQAFGELMELHDERQRSGAGKKP